MTKSSKDPWTCGGCAMVAIVTTLGIFFCIAIVGWIGFQAGEGKAAAELNRQLDELRKRGAPIDNQSLDAFYKSRTTSEDSEAWCRILDYLDSKAFKSTTHGVEDFDENAVGTGPSSKGWSGESRYRELISETAELRAEIRTLAAKKQRVRFPIVFNSFSTLIPYIQGTRVAAQLFNVEFAVAIADGDSNRIRQSIETQFQISMVCENEPCLVCQLVCIAEKEMALANLKMAVEKNRLQQADLEILLNMLQSTPSQFLQWPLVIQGERAIAYSIFDKPFNKVIGQSNEPSSTDWVRPLGITHASTRDKLNYLRHLKELESLDVTTSDRAIESAEVAEVNLATQLSNAGVLEFRDWIYTQSTISDSGYAVSAFAQIDTTIDLCRLAIAIRLFQFKYGKLPDRLDQVNEFGVDSSQMKPMGGNPFGYRRTSKSSILWGPMRDARMGETMPTSDEPPEVDARNEGVKTEMIKQSVWQFGK